MVSPIPKSERDKANSISLFPAFFKWSDCKSKSEKKPDTINIKVTELETWESEYSINLNADVMQPLPKKQSLAEREFIEMSISLKSHESKNSALLDLWNKAVKLNRIKLGDTIAIQTWLGKSTKSDYAMRRWRLIKND